MWGQAVISVGLVKLSRIIPTRVGTRKVCFACCSFSRDHPHACGDKHLSTVLLCRQLGSSPRVWGQASKSMSAGNMSRIIPTRVGTSVIQQAVNDYRKDHPHACGDKALSKSVCDDTLGSSPRVWGQVMQIW